MQGDFAMINAFKANFEHLYRERDPRAYYRVLGELDYAIPDLARPIIVRLLDVRRTNKTRKLKLLDVGCSYGINAALHRYPLSLDLLRRRYASPDVERLSAADLVHADQHFFAKQTDTGIADFIGLDRSKPAIEYARAVKLLDHAITNDLEHTPLRSAEVSLLREIDVILATGCIGYITEKTYRALLEAMPRAPWVISFVLRIFPFERVARVLEDYGLVTEQLQGRTFAQRRFQDQREADWAQRVLCDRGIDVTDLERKGSLHAELYVSRPIADVQEQPLSQIIAP